MLAGIRIIELEGLGPAPFAGMMLADLGAEVIVVHREQRTELGIPDPNILDRGKKSVVLNLKLPKNITTLKRLVATADGLIEGFRPGVAERLGFGPEEFRRDHPGLVYGRVTGWGQTGPLAHDAGHDLNYLGLSGALWYASDPDTAPFPPPTILGDVAGGSLYLVTGMLAGLIKAQATGQGTVVDAAIVDGAAHMMSLIMAARSGGLLGNARGGSPLDGSPWSRCYRCADGKWIAVQCLEERFYSIFRATLGMNNDSTFERSPDPKTWPVLTKRIEKIVRSKTQVEWTSLFRGSDACVTPVLDPTEAMLDPHLSHRNTWTTVVGELQPRAAPRFSSWEQAEPPPPPQRGEHTIEILGELQ